MHLLVIIALYINAINFINLLFQYVNLAFPDALESYYYSGAAGSIRWAMASLIIVFPVYLFVTRLLNKEYKKYPEKRDLKIRKWLVYLTLFVAAVVIIGDLVALVYNFLGGDLTARFILKVLIVLLVSGVVFIYYLRELRNSWRGSQLKVLAWVVSLVILAAIVLGFFTAGSPFKARLIRFDERRVSDLQMIQGEIINYWINKEKLPANLDELKNDITGFRPPVDPKNRTAYEYGFKSGLMFELCATFELSSNALVAQKEPINVPRPYGPYDYNWDHSEGRVCFERKIDPELYGKKMEPKIRN